MPTGRRLRVPTLLICCVCGIFAATQATLRNPTPAVADMYFDPSDLPDHEGGGSDGLSLPDDGGDGLFGVPPDAAAPAGEDYETWNPLAAGSMYYVATDGNDANPGSIGEPWRTLQHAVNMAGPGDTIRLREGVYSPTPGSDYVAQVTGSGTFGAPIRIESRPGEQAVLDVSVNGARRNWGIYVNGADHIIISGLEIRGAKRAGIRVTGGDYYVIENCLIHDVREVTSVNIVTAGIAVVNAESAGGVIRGNEVHDCSLGIILRNDLGGRIGNSLVERNYIHDIHWWNASGAYDDKNADGLVLNNGLECVVRRNVIARCGDDGVDCYDSNYCTLESNTVYNIGDGLSGSPIDANGDGNGIKVSTGGGGSHLVMRNVVFNCERIGFDQDHVDTTAPGNTFLHNISYGNRRNGWIFERASATPNLMRNNIAFANDQDNANYVDIRVVSPATVDSDYNFWSDGAFPSGDGGHSLAGDPMLLSPPPPATMIADPADIGLSVAPDSITFGIVPGLSLEPGSPAIDAGADVGQFFFHNAPDLGPYEMH